MTPTPTTPSLDELEEAEKTTILEIIGHLGAALTQSIPSDDQIIINHVRAAHNAALALWRGRRRS